MSNRNQWFIESANKIANCILVGLLWCLFSAGIITIGAAAAAGMYSMKKVVRQNIGYPWHTFIDSFRKNFRPLLPFCATFLAITSINLFGLYIVFIASSNYFSVFYMFFLVIALYFLISAQIHCYALQGLFVLNARELRSVTIRMTFSYPLRNLILVGLLVISAIICRYIWPLIFFLPGTFLLAASYLQEPMFHRFIRYTDPDDSDESE